MNPNPNVPWPAGAIEVGDWRLDGGTARCFHGTSRFVAEDVTGSVDFYIRISGDHPLSAAAARQIAPGALIAAADEVDQMAEYDYGPQS
jgi:hypothetical protein